MTRRPKSPYDSFGKDTREFLDEVDYRCRSACRALEILIAHQGQKIVTPLSFKELTSLRFIMVRFAILELCTLIDSNGRLSLRLRRRRDGKYLPQRDRLTKLFPTLTSMEYDDLLRKIAKLTMAHSTLIDRMLHTRNTRIAHAGSWSGSLDPKTLKVTRFPKMRCIRFAAGLNTIFWELATGLDLSRPAPMRPSPWP
jgi:hypothetical protein